jgi:hypothetical protein
VLLGSLLHSAMFLITERAVQTEGGWARPCVCEYRLVRDRSTQRAGCDAGAGCAGDWASGKASSLPHGCGAEGSGGALCGACEGRTGDWATSSGQASGLIAERANRHGSVSDISDRSGGAMAATVWSCMLGSCEAVFMLCWVVIGSALVGFR